MTTTQALDLIFTWGVVAILAIGVAGSIVSFAIHIIRNIRMEWRGEQ